MHRAGLFRHAQERGEELLEHRAQGQVPAPAQSLSLLLPVATQLSPQQRLIFIFLTYIFFAYFFFLIVDPSFFLV